jgi:hypothetical protein
VTIKRLFSKKGIFFACAGALAGSHVFGDPAVAAIGVTVSADRSRGHVDCHYTVTNHGSKPIVGFVLGAGVEAAGPYELTLTPKGLLSPRGWEFEVLSPDPNQKLAVEWQTKNYEKALMPGRIMDELTIRYDMRDMPCGGLHWTAINRDSELTSGIVD